MMNDRATRRQEVVEAMARHLLETGLRGASLRLMAAAAGTSDRMLLYYFNNKDELLTAVLVEVTGRLLPILDAAVDLRPREPGALLREIVAVVGRPGIQVFMQLWLELAAAAGRREQPYLAIAGQIADGFLGWIEARLAVEEGPGRFMAATRLLALVEGAAVLNAVGRGQAAVAAITGGE